MCPGQRTSTSISTSSLAANQGVSCKQGRCRRKTVCPSLLALAPVLSREPVWRPEIKCKVNVTNTRCLSHRAQTVCRGATDICFSSLHRSQLLHRLLVPTKVTAGTGSGWTHHFRLQQKRAGEHSATLCCKSTPDRERLAQVLSIPRAHSL